MKYDNQHLDAVDDYKSRELIDDYVEDLERLAAHFEVTVDYYIAEFMWCKKYHTALLVIHSGIQFLFHQSIMKITLHPISIQLWLHYKHGKQTKHMLTYAPTVTLNSI